MPDFRIIQVDAFADRPFTGNPAAVMPLDSWLPDETMQAIAEENNLSETAFTVPADGDADYELRWFTPTTEVALCGHATLASGHALIEGETIRFRTRKAGVLVVGRDGDGYSLDLPETLVREADAGQVAGLVSRDGTALVDLLGTGGKGEVFLSYQGSEATAIVLLDSEDEVRRCKPDMARLGEIELMVIVTAAGSGGHDTAAGSGRHDTAAGSGRHDVVSRVFVPAWGVDEDPVTGSAHAALTPFWCERLGRDAFTAYQASRRGGEVRCRKQGERTILGGRCVTVIEGVLRI